MAKRLYVGNLSWGTNEDSLRSFFGSVGNVASVQVMMDKFTGKARGFAFVEMASDEEAEKAVAELNGKDLDGRQIVVNEAREREERSNTGGGGYNRNGNGGNGGGGYNRGGGNPRFDRRDR